MNDLDLNEQHQSNVSAYLRFCKYQRGQRLRSVDACFQDVKDTRLAEDTYTSDEVIEILDSLADVVRAEVEGELIHDSHTNSLLLSQLFAQAQKWHLDLQVDTSDLENQLENFQQVLQTIAKMRTPYHLHETLRVHVPPEQISGFLSQQIEKQISNTNLRELIEEIRKFEDEGRVADLTSPTRKTLAPLNDGGGPVALLQARIQALTEENADLTKKLKSIDNMLTDTSKDKADIRLALQAAHEELSKVKQNIAHRPTEDDVTELSDEVEKMRLELTSQTEIHESTQEQMTKDLSSYKNSLLQVKSQLMLAEKELEKKFSQTGAYQNMKKMLNKKNEQIKEMRKKLEQYEPNSEEVTEE